MTSSKSAFTIPNLIAKKRDKEKFTKDEIEAFIKELVQGKVETSQLGMLYKFNKLFFNLEDLRKKFVKIL